MNDKQFEAVTSFKYLGATLCKNDTSSAEVGNRTASAMTRLNSIKWCNTISFASKLKLYKSLVTFILLYGCEAWTLLADSEKRIQAFEAKCIRNFSVFPTWSTRPTTGCRARSTSLWVCKNLFLQLSRNGNLYGLGMSHAMTASPKPSFTAPWRVGQHRRQQKKCWMDNIKEWTYLSMPELFTRASCRKDWNKISAESSPMFTHLQRPNQSRDC